MTDMEANALCADLALAIMASASVKKIKPIDWWPRCRSALEAAGAKAQDISGMIAEMARKLQIDGAFDARSVEAMQPVIALCQDGATFQSIRKAAATRAIFVTAMAQMRRSADKAARGIE